MKFIKGLGLLSIVLFSFYYTEKISNYVLEKNPLYQEIKLNKDNYDIKSISASISDGFVTPGLNGKVVDLKSSYYNMKDINRFNPYYLVYKEVSPKVTIENVKDKVINKGNSMKYSIALVLEYDEKIINYLSKYNISVLVDNNTFKERCNYEQINNDINNYKKVDKLINKYHNNSNICILNNLNDICFLEEKIIVKPTKIIDNGTFFRVVNDINSGDIILIRKNTKLENLSVLMKHILYKDYKINYLSNHISENRD